MSKKTFDSSVVAMLDMLYDSPGGEEKFAELITKEFQEIAYNPQGFFYTRRPPTGEDFLELINSTYKNLGQNASLNRTSSFNAALTGLERALGLGGPVEDGADPGFLFGYDLGSLIKRMLDN